MTRRELLLTQLAEELAEAVQDISKSLRFGLDEKYVHSEFTNIERVMNELIDVYAMIELLEAEGVFPKWGLFNKARIKEKKEKVEKLLKYSKECGRLDD